LCRALAPATFARVGLQSAVAAQPGGEAERLAALLALLACPTASIHAPHASSAELAAAQDSFPLPVTDHVAYCGFHSEKSFGAASYFIRRASSNVLVESPRFSERLARKLESLGGVSHIFLSHVDDVADAAAWAARFPGALRVAHELERIPAERQLTGAGPWSLDGEGDCSILFTPGHTRGSLSLLHSADGGSLFSGDSLCGSNGDEQRLAIFTDFNWFSVPRQLDSVEALRGVPFVRVLPGHGRRARWASVADKDAAIERLLAEHGRRGAC